VKQKQKVVMYIYHLLLAIVLFDISSFLCRSTGIAAEPA